MGLVLAKTRGTMAINTVVNERGFHRTRILQGNQNFPKILPQELCKNPEILHKRFQHNISVTRGVFRNTRMIFSSLDVVTTKFGQARIKSIDLYEVHAMVGDPISVKSVWSNLTDRCVFDLDNNKWVYGYQIENQ